MATLTLDTHKIISRLKEAGFDEAKVAAVVSSLQEINLEHLVTKQDLEMALSNLETRLYKSGLFALLAQAALIVALIELLGG